MCSGAGVFSLAGNVLWIIFGGWGLARGHIVTGALLCVTVIGIPLGHEIVDSDDPRSFVG